jgi:uncharacterized protein (UPF0261 family)
MSQSVVLIATLDTKAEATRFLKEQIEQAGCRTLVIDAGVLGQPGFVPDITREEVAKTAGSSIASLQSIGHRGNAVTTMSKGVRQVLLNLFQKGKVDGVVSLGGGQGTIIATTAMQALPVGVPKLMVSTMASGVTHHYVGTKDIAMVFSVVDIIGLNGILRQILTNAAGSICGMVKQQQKQTSGEKLIGITSFGITTPCVIACKELLENAGFEVAVFHATGTGGRAMEEMILEGLLVGVLDVTTTELADELVGGILSAGPDRLEAAGKKGIPQVVVPGALDVVNFGARDTVPSQFRERQLHQHSPVATLMRTSKEENAVLGQMVAEKLNRAIGPVVVCIPNKGFSDYDKEDGPLYDPDADSAFTRSLSERLRKNIPLRLINAHINDSEFAFIVTQSLFELIQ